MDAIIVSLKQWKNTHVHASTDSHCVYTIATNIITNPFEKRFIFGNTIDTYLNNMRLFCWKIYILPFHCCHITCAYPRICKLLYCTEETCGFSTWQTLKIIITCMFYDISNLVKEFTFLPSFQSHIAEYESLMDFMRKKNTTVS